MTEDFELPEMVDFTTGEDEESDNVFSDDTLNYLFIGRKKLYRKLQPYVQKFGDINFHYTSTIDEAIDLLLVEIYAVVMLDNEDRNMDIITNSRIVRVNHPLARIVGLSVSRHSLFIADIINHGAVDAYLPLPFEERELMTILSEQQAKHDIDRMLTNFVTSPPQLSSASYLLLDPSLSADEEEPIKFVGLMIAYRSVPRYSHYFEDLLAKDEILFAGYLSGITMLGQELLKSKDQLKEINFGGISVIFRFSGEIQFSIFVRNLSKHNVEETENVISNVVERFVEETGSDLASSKRPSNEALNKMDEIAEDFQIANQEVKASTERGQKDLTLGGQKVMFYGTDAEEQRKVKNYLSKRVEYTIICFTDETEVKEYLRENNISVLVLDSDLENTKGQNPLPFADFVRDDYPYTQVIYQMRDRRASGPIIRSLNSGAVNYLISYKSTRKDLIDWIERAMERAIEIRDQSKEVEMDGGLNSALAAKTKIRLNQQSYLSGNIPILEGLFISERELPIFKRFWGDNSLQYDDSMLAGLVASLESVGGEMFYDDNDIGGLELGDSNIMVEHRQDMNIIFFVRNLASHNVNIVDKHIKSYADGLYSIIQATDDYKDHQVQAQLDTKANRILGEFMETFDSS